MSRGLRVMRKHVGQTVGEGAASGGRTESAANGRGRMGSLPERASEGRSIGGSP